MKSASILLKITTFALVAACAYTWAMSIFVKAVAAPSARSDAAKQVAVAYAALLAVMAVAQLFTFETLPALFESFGLPVGEPFVVALPAIVVALEVLALPFLLRMVLSPAFRVLSMGAGWLVALFWIFTASWVVAVQPLAETVGFLGTVVSLIPGVWAIGFSCLMGLASAWASWGLWPHASAKVKKK